MPLYLLADHAQGQKDGRRAVWTGAVRLNNAFFIAEGRAGGIVNA